MTVAKQIPPKGQRWRKESLTGQEPQSSRAGEVGTAKQSSQPPEEIIGSLEVTQ